MRRFALITCVALVAACSRGPDPNSQVAPLPNRPLAGLAGQQVIVLPVHYLRPGDSLGWAAAVERPRQLLSDVDDEIAFALEERGFRTRWVFPEQLVRSAQRNAAHSPDPRALAAEGLRPLARRRSDGQLGEPLASQLRALVALHGARYALFPVELRFEKIGGAGRAVLHVLLIDARLSRATWGADVHGDTASTYGRGSIASAANNLANLIAAP
ncbi:MAG TPA: hypothetical protein VFH14_13680 [Gemmatimonadaceae bacterium]|nr:hypothetical protein [Gemmatimonadaceae bacterium]